MFQHRHFDQYSITWGRMNSFFFSPSRFDSVGFDLIRISEKNKIVNNAFRFRFVPLNQIIYEVSCFFSPTSAEKYFKASNMSIMSSNWKEIGSKIYHKSIDLELCVAAAAATTLAIQTDIRFGSVRVTGRIQGPVYMCYYSKLFPGKYETGIQSRVIKLSS